MMTVSNLLHSKGQDIFCVETGTEITEASKCMAYHYIGALLVIDQDGEPKGIVTERDIAFAVHKFGTEVCEMKVEALMSPSIHTCTSETTIAEAVEIMVEHEIRHLPVKDGDLLKGLISMRDVMNDRLVELELENKTLRELMEGEAA